MFTIISAVLPALLLALIQDPVSDHRTDWLQLDGNEIAIDVRVGTEPTLLELVRLCEHIRGPRFYVMGAEEEYLSRQHLRPIAARWPTETFFSFVQGVLRAHEIGCARIAVEPQLIVRPVLLRGDGLNAMKAATPFIENSAISAHAGDHALLYSTFFPLAYLEPQQATVLLSRAFSANALEGFGAQVSTNGVSGLYLVGFGSTLHALSELLRSMDVPRAAEDLGRLHCEVWQLDDPLLVAQVEELAADGRTGEAKRLLRTAEAGAMRIAHYQGATSNLGPSKLSSQGSGAEEQWDSELELLPSMAHTDALHLEWKLRITGRSPQHRFDAKFSATTRIAYHEEQMFLSTTQRGCTVLFLGLR